MTAATVALKVMQYYQMLLMAGMMFFPGPFAEGYKLEFSEPEAAGGSVFSLFGGKPPPCFSVGKTLMYMMFNVFGIQIGFAAFLAAALTRAEVSVAAQSMACLGFACTYSFFLVNDLSYALSPEWPENVPKDGIFANSAVWLVLIAMLLYAWSSSGKVCPAFAKMMPSGRFAGPLMAFCASTLMYAIGCIAARNETFELFFPGVSVCTRIAPDVRYFILLLIGNIGKFMLCNIAMLLCAVSVGDEDTSYRVLRAASFSVMFFLGSFSKDATTFLVTGWADGMRVATFVQNFGVGFYMVTSWTSVPFTLK